MTLHDPAITRIRARADRRCHRMGLGLILLDDIYPSFPGDVRNASAWPFPVQQDVAESVDIHGLVRGDDTKRLLEPVRASARRLQRMGCRAIAAECGCFAWFQRDLAAAGRVPVFSPSLLQVPIAQQLVGPEELVGVLVAETDRLHIRHLSPLGITPGSSYVIAGAKDGGRCPEFDSLLTASLRPGLPTADYARAEADILAVTRDFVADNPEMQALALECTGFQPFARAIQRQIDLPVFSWSTLFDNAYSVVAHHDFYGHV